MKINDFWDEIGAVFKGHSDQIKEIDLIKLKSGSMSQCLQYLMHNAKDCSSRFMIPGTETSGSLAVATYRRELCFAATGVGCHVVIFPRNSHVEYLH